MTTKTSKTAKELEAELTKALKAHPECSGVAGVKLKRLDHNHGIANWDAEFEAVPGETISPDCKRVALSAKQGVQKHYDMAGD